ncbi:hypothetical protein BFP72_14820 [Reichenbachiella sp. 5M10]|uniref:DUF418 domain-containing protein n=1 Tax=Reichenbachiella sp. 5M10 TaxID=1889772 RepID=UPI000C147832|nr:DUF418 domain-containing protein [Reichenbachiella sp. 5M10]PIB36582.1 hypothetical protein BFP72_14820 [Reichenbachiella sp. 5M10]
MMSSSSPRIPIIDALRGFALLGIILIHCIEHFEVFLPTNADSSWVTSYDEQVYEAVIFLVSGKAYSIFALLFGYSFFIQMNRQEMKGVDFRPIFAWRLVILLGMGLLHSMIYRGDILHIYALMGMPMMVFYGVPSRILLWIAGLLILQPVLLYLVATSFMDPEFVYAPYYGDGNFEEGERIYSAGTLGEVLQYNLYRARVVVWAWTYHNGRFFQLMALFLVGLVMARHQFLEQLSLYRSKVVFLGYFTLLIMLLFNLYVGAIEDFAWTDTQKALVTTTVQSYLNVFYTLAICSVFVLIFLFLESRIKLFVYFSAYGRMSLTNYMSQAILGVVLFYGFGLGWYATVGAVWSLVLGGVIFTVQAAISWCWLQHHRYGPMEWLWRVLTYRDFSIPIKN